MTMKNDLKEKTAKLSQLAKKHWRDILIALLVALLAVYMIDSSAITDNFSREQVVAAAVLLLLVGLKPARNLVVKAVKAGVGAVKIAVKQWKRSLVVLAFLLLSGSLFVAAEALQEPVDLGLAEIEKIQLNDSEQEFELYNECVRLKDEAESRRDLEDAFGKCLETEETLPHDSEVDARSKWKRAEILAILAVNENPVDYEKLLEARSLFYEVLAILPPESDMLKDVQINIEKLTMSAKEQMQKQLSEKGRDADKIDEFIDQALEFENEEFQEDEPGDDRY